MLILHCQIKNFKGMKISAKIGLMLFFISTIVDASAKLKLIGHVLFPDNYVYPYTIELEYKNGKKDTKTFNDSIFQINCSDFNVKEMKLSSLGFESIVKTLSIQKSELSGDSIYYCDTISFKETSHMLDEVVVEAKKMLVKNTGLDFVISNIQGSYLGDSGSMLDMLAWTPGVSVANGEDIKVLGRGGSPIIYINGEQVINITQLRAMQSKTVKKIEIIREPNASYPSGASSVINITTDIPIGNILNLNLLDNIRFSEKISNRISSSVWGKYKGFSFNMSLSYSQNRSKQSSNNLLTVLGENDENIKEFHTIKDDNISGNRYYWYIGCVYNHKKKNMFQLQYTGSILDNDRLSETEIEEKTYENIEQRKYETKRHNSPESHSILGSYRYKLNGYTLNVNANYNLNTNDRIEKISEEYVTLERINEYKYRYSNVLFKTDLSWRFAKKDSENLGFYIGTTTSKVNSIYTENDEQWTASKNTWVEGFYNFKYNNAPFQLSVGINGRYEVQNVESNDLNWAKFRKSYFNLSPNVIFTQEIKPGYTIRASYKYSYRLPTYSQLNPAYKYSDIIHYYQGNPNLKPTYTHRGTLSGNIKKVTLSVEYYNHKNAILNITEPIANTDKFLTSPINMSGNYDWAFSTEYTLMPSIFRIYLRAGLIDSHVKYYSQGQLLKQSMLFFQGNINFALNIQKKYNLFLTMDYNSPQLINNIKQSYTCNLSVGADARFFKNKLYARIEINDIFRRSVTPSWTQYSPYIYQHHINKYDTRYASLTLSYQFTSAKHSVKRSVINQDELRRIQE